MLPISQPWLLEYPGLVQGSLLPGHKTEQSEHISKGLSYNHFVYYWYNSEQVLSSFCYHKNQSPYKPPHSRIYLLIESLYKKAVIWTGLLFHWLISAKVIAVAVQSLSHVNSFQLLRLQHTRLPCLSVSPGVHSNSSPLSWWCHLVISSSVTRFCSCP